MGRVLLVVLFLVGLGLVAYPKSPYYQAEKIEQLRSYVPKNGQVAGIQTQDIPNISPALHTASKIFFEQSTQSQSANELSERIQTSIQTLPTTIGKELLVAYCTQVVREATASGH